MKQKHVILKFDYEDTTWKTLVSKTKFDPPIHDAKFIKIVDFSPGAVLFMFSCDLTDDGSFFSNIEDSPMITFSLGGMIGKHAVKMQVSPAKSFVREMTVKMFHRNRAIIYAGRRDHARTHLISHHGSEDSLTKR